MEISSAKIKVMIRIYFCLYCILSFVIVSCNSSNRKELLFNSPQFNDTINIRGRVLNDTFIMGAAYDIDFYHDYLIIQAFRGSEEGKLHFFNCSDGDYLKSIVTKGRGPGEAMSVVDFDVNRDSGDVVFFDSMGQKLFHFNIDSVVLNDNYKDYIFSEIYPIYMYATYWGKEGYIAKEGFKLPTGEYTRFSIIHDDTVVYRYGVYPEFFVPGVPQGVNIIYRSYSHIGISPDKTKLVCALGLGAVLEIFDIKENKIILNTIKGFHKPIFDVDRNQLIKPVSGETIYGFSDLYLTSKYIYTQYSSDSDSKIVSDIAVFNWHGECIRLYHTDYDLIRICVDENKGKVYSICKNQNHENILVEFDLNE